VFTPQALTLNRVVLIAGQLLAVPMVSFAVSFPTGRERFALGWSLLLAPVLVFGILTAFTDAIIADVQIRSWGTNVVQGNLFPLLTAWGAIVCVAVSVHLTRKYRAADSTQRAQFKYLFVGLGFFFFSALLIGALLPTLSGANELSTLMPLTTVLLLVPTAYAMVRHRLLDIRFVVLRTLTYVPLIVLTGGLWVLFIELVQTRIGAYFHVDSRILALITGLVLALGFQPLRVALDRATDRYFFGKTYHPDHLLDRLGQAMAVTLDRRKLASLLSDELRGEMHLALVSVMYVTQDRPLHVDSGDGLSDAAVLRLLAVETEGKILIADELDPDSPERKVMRDSGVEVLAPLLGDGHWLGVIMLGAKTSGRAYSIHDTRFLEVLTSEAAIAARNAQLFEERNQRVRELTALNRLAFSLGTDTELGTLLKSGLDDIVAVTTADSGSIMLLDHDSGTLSIAASLGIDPEVAARTRVPVGEQIAGWVAETRRPLILVGDSDQRFAGELKRDDIISAISAPVMSKDEVIGVINVNRKTLGEIFSRENLNVVTSFAGQLGSAVENARLYTDLEKTFLGTITALAAAVDAKDPYTFGHSNDVTAYAVATAEKMGLAPHEIEVIRIGSTLHDIGKIGIDRAILHKPGRLDEDEWAAIRRHPAIGADILAPLDFLGDSLPLVLFHHERYDGKGYPSGVSGESIPLGARIIAVADTFNAMTSDRPYRKALPVEVAVQEVRDNAGTQFDPDVAAAFLEVVAEQQALAVAHPTLNEQRTLTNNALCVVKRSA
jgi:HD-GYP domain-containing protein (c-di-GMP phosphodiesterase class II)